VPDIADRHRNTQLTALGFCTGGAEHAGAQDAGLELADRALHPEQQPVIGQARVVDAVLIDDARLHQATEFEEVMPVSPAARQT
jgi:hypothetical protein